MQVMHDDDNNITICTALYQSFGSSGFMSPAECLHFSALVCLLPEARVGGHGYSSLLVCLFVCLFVCHRYIYSPGCHSTAFTAWIAFTQQYLDLNSGRFCC